MIKLTLKFVLSALLMLAFTSGVQAQDEKPVNVQKELKKILKELPRDAQLEILGYAERKAEAIKIAKERVAAQSAAPKPAQAAAPATEAKTVKLNQQQAAAVSAQPAPARPNTPGYVDEAQNMEQTTVEWYEEFHDFGKITEGTLAKHTFKFKNTGEHPLKLTRVKASCGCTTPDWSKEPIQPGEEGYVTVSFNSKGRPGMQNKAVTITGNFPNLHRVLRFRTEVQPRSATQPEN